MKNVADIFDIILLIIVLGIMLPILFGSIKPLINMESWGFTDKDDKTMRSYKGDVLIDATGNGSVTAAEILLMAETASKDILKYNGFILPDGQSIIFDDNYEINKNGYLTAIRNSLENTRLYEIKFDYEAGIWRIYNK